MKNSNHIKLLSEIYCTFNSLKITVMTDFLSMDQAFIRKLTEIVLANLANENFDVDELAKEAGISRYTIHRRLRSIRHQSVSQFIREIKLQRAMEMLQNNMATASEIAFIVGFGSHTYFTKCFHEYYGYPPGEVRKKASEILEVSREVVEPLSPHKKSNKAAIIVGSIIIFALITLGLFFIPKLYHLKEEREISIVILPFKNLTGLIDQEFIVQGLREALISELGKISTVKPLRVLSGHTASVCASSSISIPEIAEEENIDYFIEGSVLPVIDSNNLQLRIIQAFPKEKIVWSDNYTIDRKIILKLFSNIVGVIVQEVGLDLLNLPEPSIFNPQSYKAYNRGMPELEKQTVEGNRKGLEYLHEAERINPEDAFANAGLALGYLTIAHSPLDPGDALEKGEEYAKKAFELDSTFAEVHVALAEV